MDEFFKTTMGKRFYEGTMPQIQKELKRIADAMEKANELKEKELEALWQEKK